MVLIRRHYPWGNVVGLWEVSFMKGSKRDRWFKDGLKVSRRWYKKLWNRRVRHSRFSKDGGYYKRLAGESMWDGVL